MPRSRTPAIVFAAAILAAACQPEEKSTRLTVMSRNLYLGAELNTLLGALVGIETGQIPMNPDPIETLLKPLALQAWTAVQATDFPARAKVIAGEIAAQQPDIVGLQEVALWRTGAASPPTTVVYDFLSLVLTELTARGLTYQVASSVQSFDGDLPLPDTSWVRYTDYDVILVRAGIATTGAKGRNYVARAPLTTANGPLRGGPLGRDLAVVRGWTSVEVEKDGVRFRVYETHLEVEAPPLNLFQAGQAAELAFILANEPLPTILIGDLNSDGARSDPVASTPTYPLLLDLGFGDPWADLHPGDPGFSCCNADPTLVTSPNAFAQRVDHALYRGGFRPTSATIVPPAKTPAVPSSPTGLYDSDHSALAASFEITVPGAR